MRISEFAVNLPVAGWDIREVRRCTSVSLSAAVRNGVARIVREKPEERTADHPLGGSDGSDSNHSASSSTPITGRLLG
ncbi:hypothetical protein GCM10022377_10460 [Zhihengliuella alba]|uniref:Transposase n=1 Tax=Zhihengliuella alba TaxID=547018 RepID=A0ABP7D515_9MICC